MDTTFGKYLSGIDALAAAWKAKIDSDLETERARMYGEVDRLTDELRAKVAALAAKLLECRVAAADPPAGLVVPLKTGRRGR
jgi:Skp family chaperone for outer membrane proteins